MASSSQVNSFSTSSGLLPCGVLCCQISRIGPISTGAVFDCCKIPVSGHVGRSVRGRGAETCMPMRTAGFDLQSKVRISVYLYVVCMYMRVWPLVERVVERGHSILPPTGVLIKSARLTAVGWRMNGALYMLEK